MTDDVTAPRWAIDRACPACGHRGMTGFHREPEVPANSNLLLDDPELAINFPRGAIELGHCSVCGFIANTAFDPELAEYGQRYEETQAFSARFLEFAESLAEGWIDRYDLHGKRVLEIGCGKGEFLTLMAERGIGHGVGIDPGVKPERISSSFEGRVEWLPRLFTPEDVDLIGDAVVCRHTLEHVHPAGEFLAGIRRAIGDRLDTVLLFELPDTQRILDEVAFWDVYYEHCAYFTQGSVARLFERCGFQLLDVRYEYDGQYLIVEARPVAPDDPVTPWGYDDLGAIERGIDHFSAGYADMSTAWRQRLAELTQRGGTSVVWGASSKAVAFLAVTGDHVAAAVDINPYKHGSYMAGTGHPVIAPEALASMQPDLVVAMNPIYMKEIQGDLDRLGVRAALVAL